MCAYDDLRGGTEGENQGTRRFLRRLLLLSAAVVALIGAISIIGWVTNTLIIDSIISDYVPIALSTSIFILILSFALFECAMRKAYPMLKHAAMACAIIVLALCIWIILPIQPDPEDFIDPVGTIVGGYSIGRASPISIIAIIFSSIDLTIILAGLHMRSKYALYSSTVLSLSVLSIGALTTVGYLYGNPLLYGEPIRPIAFLAGISLLLLGIGTILSKGPGYWPLSSFIGSSVKARLLKILLPLSIGIIFAEGFILTAILPDVANPVVIASTIAFLTAVAMGIAISRASRWVGGEIDRTQRELINLGEELSRANEKLKVLDSITRHDTINQLTILMGRLGILKSSVSDKEVLRRIDDSIRAAGSIDATIKFSREYQDIGASGPIWINVGQALSSSLKVVHVPESVSVSAEVNGVEVLADGMFEKVLINLLDNSLRYAEHLSGIRVSHELRADGALVIVLEDDGVGIPDEDKGKLFTRGFGKHTGLGLYLSKEILGYTGITISEHGVPGKGVRFEIRVPQEKYRIAPCAQKSS